MFIKKHLRIAQTEKGKSLFTEEDIGKDEVILEFQKNFQDYSTVTTLQIGEHLHQENTDSTAAENFINHSCNPNGYIDFENLSFRALRPIFKGEELTFNYLTSEWDMAEGFECRCHVKDCLEKIRGCKYLTAEQKQELEPLLSPFLRKKAEEETASVSSRPGKKRF